MCSQKIAGSYCTASSFPVLVTGGCGFIGHHLVFRLLSRGYQVTILDNLSTGRRTSLPSHPNLDFIEGSVLDEETVRQAGRKAKLVFHLASIVGMQEVVRQRELTYQTSVVGTENVLKATANAPIVLFSSSAVYGLESQGKVQEKRAISEDLALAYDGYQRGYAMGKSKMDLMGQQAARAGRQVMILRPCNVIGSGQSGAYGMVLPRFIEQAASCEPLTIFDDGRQSRCFSCVEQFVSCVMQLITEPKAWKHPLNVINIGSKRSTTILELAQIVLKETGSSSPLKFIPYKQFFLGKQDVRGRVPDTQRLKELVGSVNWPDIRTIVRSIVQEGRNRETQKSQYEYGFLHIKGNTTI